MRKISLTITQGDLQIIETPKEEWHEDGISIDFFVKMEGISEKELIPIVKRQINKLDWMSAEGDNFIFDLIKIKKAFPSIFESCSWMSGEMIINPIIEDALDDNFRVINFSVSKENIERDLPMKIFLSHKGSNKPMVTEFFKVLEELGFSPWFDDDAMVAGVDLDRGILQGMKDSCGCVFFITPEFVDEEHLADEVTYAKMEKRKKKDKFSIITLQFTDSETGEKGKIPELLEQYVWKQPSSDSEALKEIIRALPIKLGRPNWRV